MIKKCFSQNILNWRINWFKIRKYLRIILVFWKESYRRWVRSWLVIRLKICHKHNLIIMVMVMVKIRIIWDWLWCDYKRKLSKKIINWNKWSKIFICWKKPSLNWRKNKIFWINIHKNMQNYRKIMLIYRLN